MDGVITVNNASHADSPGVSSTRSSQISESSTTAIAPASANGQYVPEDDEGSSSSGLSWSDDSLLFNDELRVKNCEFEVAIRPLPASRREEYKDIRSNVVEQIIDEVRSPDGELWYQVEFRDGRHNVVSMEELRQYPNGPAALAELLAVTASDDDRIDVQRETRGTKRKRRFLHEVKSQSDSEDSESEAEEASFSLIRRMHGRVPRSQQPSRQRPADEEPKRSGLRWLRPRRLMSQMQNYDDQDMDELAGLPPEESSSDDGGFSPIRSDIAGPGRPGRRPRLRRRSKRLKTRYRSTTAPSRSRESSIEFEAPARRSSRANKNSKNMRENSVADFDSFYQYEEKGPAVPKVVTTKEVFKALLDDSEFARVHIKDCNSCQQGRSFTKGPLIYCQGCSLAFHRTCIGMRITREHMVTKVGEDDFVLQCRYCVGRVRNLRSKGPRQDMCQACGEVGRSCAAFSERKTAKQEEQIREQNGGVDPITPVSKDFINNPDNVLFRCLSCRRAWHIEHLPTTRSTEPDPSSVRDERLKEYSVDWKCNDCAAQNQSIDTLVAWRPANGVSSLEAVPYDEVCEDDKEYLVKWKNRSYFHCVWKPGAWVWEIAAPVTRAAFGRRASTEALLKLDSKAAVPEEYLLPDIILAVKYRDESSRTTKQEDLARISKITSIFVKFQGLGYEDVVWDDPPGTTSFAYPAFKTAYEEYVNGKHFKVEPPQKIKDRVQSFKDRDFRTDVELSEQPKGLRGKLMKYQLQGVNWMLHRYHQDQNAILADEMGLGKTVQVIALISSLVLNAPKCWPFLIVVPNSTCPNWRREIKWWAPDLRVVTYHGGRQPQDLAYRHELFPNGSTELKAHIVVMSYDSAQDEKTRTLFHQVNWAGLVVDEGHRLKNDKNLLYGALRAMRFPFKLLLTGTPLQNNKRELFNLLQFVDPGQNADSLDEKFRNLTKENISELHKIINPYFYRRTKAGVLKFLPPMAQIIVPVTMTVLQQRLCKSIMSKNPELIHAIFSKSTLKLKERGSLNNILMQLRKCLCHPFMYSGAIEEKNLSPEKLHRNLVDCSAKLLLLELMLPKLHQSGHRVLIFSQFLDQLDIIEDFLLGLGLGYRRLDGSISSLEKQKRIDEFNSPNSTLFAFLLSTRAGGVGINLATADTVIIMDPDFNPHQDIQALSRAHRIGQKEKVLCFQLMTRHSVEEKIMEIGKKKMALDHALIERMDHNDPGDDLESILKHGAEALFSDTQKDVIRYDAASVEKLLERTMEETTEINAEEDTKFSFARVWANDKGTIQDNVEAEEEAPVAISAGVWEAILAEREEESRKEAERNREVLGRGGRRRRKVNYRTHDAGDDMGGSGASDADGDFVGLQDSGATSSETESSARGSKAGSADADAEEPQTQRQAKRQAKRPSHRPGRHPVKQVAQQIAGHPDPQSAKHPTTSDHLGQSRPPSGFHQRAAAAASPYTSRQQAVDMAATYQASRLPTTELERRLVGAGRIVGSATNGEPPHMTPSSATRQPVVSDQPADAQKTDPRAISSAPEFANMQVPSNLLDVRIALDRLRSYPPDTAGLTEWRQLLRDRLRQMTSKGNGK